MKPIRAWAVFCGCSKDRPCKTGLLDLQIQKDKIQPRFRGTKDMVEVEIRPLKKRKAH